MIKIEMVISMECDHCGALMTEADGHALTLPDCAEKEEVQDETE